MFALRSLAYAGIYYALISATVSEARPTIVTPIHAPNGVNVRPTQSTDHPPIGKITNSQWVLCRGCATVKTGDGTDETCRAHSWYVVTLPDGRSGFACSDYLRTIEDHEIKFTVRFLDAGGSGATIIETASSQAIVDGGESLDYLYDYLRANRLLRPLSFVAITNPAQDHWNGLAKVITNEPVQFLLAPPTWPECTPRFNELLGGGRKICGPDGCSDTFLQAYSEAGFEYLPSAPEIGIRWLSYPTDNHAVGCSALTDAASIVLQLKIADTTFLFTSDIRGKSDPEHGPEFSPEREEASLIRAWGRRLESEVLLVPHHGQKAASTLHFIETVNPRYAIILADHSDDTAIVSQCYTDAGAQVLQPSDSQAYEGRAIRCFLDNDPKIVCAADPPHHRRGER